MHIDLVTPEFLAVFWLAVAGDHQRPAAWSCGSCLRNARLHGRNLRDMLIVGTNPRAVQFARKMRDNQFLGYRVIGFVDQEWSGSDEFSQSGFNLACNFDGLLAYLRSSVVDEVVVALPMRSLHSRASEVATICEEQGILVRFISNLFDGKISRPRVVVMEGDSAHYPSHREAGGLAGRDQAHGRYRGFGCDEPVASAGVSAYGAAD